LEEHRVVSSPAVADRPLSDAILNAVGDAVIATDLAGTIIYWNAAAEDLYGWPKDEVVGRNILEVTPTSQSRSTAAAIMTILASGGTWSGNFEVQAKDGERFAVNVTDYPVRDTDGRLAAVVGISRRLPGGDDATPRDGAPPAAARTRRQLQSILFATPAELGRGFVIAATLYVTAIVSRVVLDQIVPDRLPYISFFPILAIAALFCGPWPTVVLLLALAITGALWVSPLGLNPALFWIVSSGLFLLSGAVLIAIVVRTINAQRALERIEGDRLLIIRELRHRLKNLFAIASSVAQQTVRSSLSREELAEAIAGRIQAIASAQDVLNVETMRDTDLHSLVKVITEPITPDPGRLMASGPKVPLAADTATSLALVLHELATNAVKYGAWSTGSGAVSIAWHVDGRKGVVIVWHEPPGPGIRPPREGFGTTLIKRALGQAKVHFDVGAGGVDCRIELQL
jgi:two-component system CheB/CheR fusion protein